MLDVKLPERVVANLGAFGDAGRQWAARFDETLATALRRWRLTLEAPYDGLSYNFVARVRRGQQRLALKLGVPGEELGDEIAALTAFQGRGVVRLLDADAVLGALVLERVEPGERLASVEDDDRAMAIAAQLMQSLWCEPPPGLRFPDIGRKARAVASLRESGAVPSLAAHLEAAHRILQAPTREGVEPKLLHGDFHQLNVLGRGDGGWCAIDPKGTVGDPGFDAWPLMTNLLECDDPVGRLHVRARRLEVETGLDAGRILEWTFAGAVLSLAWTLEDASPEVELAQRKLAHAVAALGSGLEA